MNDTLLVKEWITEEMRGKIVKFLDSNEKNNTMYKNLWDTVKIVLRGKFVTLSAYIKINISNKQSNVVIKILEKQEQINFKTSRRQEIRSEMKLMTCRKKKKHKRRCNKELVL